ncbi:MAG: acetylornithine deacetylase [Endozoicomonas sp. (ex Botrylloides leachii)]|nr:acetylornithine deacetylase [Endozoicomonas sp. (ex Botrylloides leachii)]
MKLSPTLIESLSRLVELPSISSTIPRIGMANLPVINELAYWLDNMGFDCEVMPLLEKGKANLIATLGKGAGGLVLAGHTDTVPCNETLWQHSPFKLIEQNNRFYGLGTCDMKGFFSLAIEASKDFLTDELKAPLIILATADEESSMNGARALANAGKPSARYAIIGEPTGMAPVYLHKGIMMERIRIVGESGHSSNPSLGRNAMETAHKVIEEILKYRNELTQRYNMPSFSIPTPTINLGCIHGGDNPNRICGNCDIDFDVRLIPGMDSQLIRSEITQRLQPIAEQDAVDLSVTELTKAIPPFNANTESDLVETCSKLTGYTAQSAAFTTEAPFFQQLGMDTVVLGPGDIDQAHQPNEYLSLDRINPTISLLKKLIKRYCL